MDGQLLNTETTSEPRAAALNRARLREARVLAVNIIGGPGCGKSSLIRSTLETLSSAVRIGVVAADPAATRDATPLRGHARQFARVNTGSENLLRASQFGEVLSRMDLGELDVILIENVDSMAGPAGVDLGQDAVAGIFSVPAGDEQAAKYPEVVAGADVVVLNKTDLLPMVPFDLAAFRADVGRINPAADLIEVSALSGGGIDIWRRWIRRLSAGRRRRDGIG